MSGRELPKYAARDPARRIERMMHVGRSVSAALLALAVSTAAFGQRLSIAPDRLPEAGVGINFFQELHVSGGSAPYTWRARGELPPGIDFDIPSSTLAGIPTKAGDFQFTVSVTDSARRTAAREYVLRVTAGNTISITWTKVPQVSGGGVFGEVEIANPGNEEFDMTFIVVAVNAIGRATALGYQHLTLARGKQKVPFGNTLPSGTYVVHADAIGENASSGRIRRARLQTRPIVVP